MQHKAIQYHVYIHIYVGRCKKKQIKINFASILPNYYFLDMCIHMYIAEMKSCIVSKWKIQTRKRNLKNKKKEKYVNAV